MKRLSIIIVTYSQVSGFPALLKEVKEQAQSLPGYTTHVTIVHNGVDRTWVEQSVDASHLRSVCTIIHTGKNVGFAVGCNIGIRSENNDPPDDYLFLNPDTQLSEEVLHKLIADQQDIAAPVLSFFRNGRQVYDYGGRVNLWLGRPTHCESDLLQDTKRTIDYVSGCCLRVKKEVIAALGGFDERYYLYFEDVDFCLRAAHAGYTVGVANTAVVHHDLVENEARSYPKRLHLLHSNWVFLRTWIIWWRQPVAVAYWLVLLLKTAI